MRRAYKLRLYPTAGQATRAAQCLRDHQRMYNAALQERREAFDPQAEGQHPVRATVRPAQGHPRKHQLPPVRGQMRPPPAGPVICPEHGSIDADVNGAKNIYTRAGLGSGQAAEVASEAGGLSRQSSH